MPSTNRSSSALHSGPGRLLPWPLQSRSQWSIGDPVHPHHLWQGRDLRGKDHVGGQVRRIARTPPDQQPAAPAGLQRRGQGPPVPVVPAGPFRPIAGTEVGPAVLRQGRQEAFDLPWLPSQPDIFLARHCQDIGLGVGFQPPPQAPVIAIHAVTRDRRARGTPAANARASCWRASCGLVAKRRSSGIPACLQRTRSFVHSWGRYSSRSTSAWPSGLA